MYTKIRVSTESWPWRRSSLAAPAGTRTSDFSITSPAVYHWAILPALISLRDWWCLNPLSCKSHVHVIFQHGIEELLASSFPSCANSGAEAHAAYHFVRVFLLSLSKTECCCRATENVHRDGLFRSLHMRQKTWRGEQVSPLSRSE